MTLPVDEIRFLRDCGESFAQIARRDGVTPASLSRRAYRQGDPELAAEIERAARAAETPRRCDCGNTVSRWSKSGRCAACARLRRLVDPTYRARLAEGARRAAERRPRDKAGRWAG